MTDYSQLSRRDLVVRLRAAETELERIRADREAGNGRADFGGDALNASTELRRCAEARLQPQQTQAARPLTEADSQRLIHKLHIHQIELELQNEELREARARLEQNLNRYADLYDFAPVGYFTVTSDGVIRELNLAGATLLGQERSHLIDRCLGLRVSRDSRPAFTAFLNQLVQGEVRETCEVTLNFEGVPLRHVRFEGVGVDSGENRRCRLVAVDITEYKQMEQALRAGEQQLSAVFRTVPAGVGVTTQRIFQQANDYFYRALGYRPDEIIGQSTRMVYPSDEAFERLDREIQDQIERTGLAVVETQTRHKDGRLLDIHLQVASLVPNQPESGRVFCALDITKRKQAEEALRQSKERLELVIEGASVGLYDVDLRTGEVVLNEHYLRMLGYTPGELVMTVQDWRDRIHPDDLLRIDRACEKAQQGRLHFAEEYRLRHKSGAWIWVLDRGKGFDWDENGEPWRLAGTHLDITERKRIEENLCESEERFRLFMDHGPVVAWIKDEEGRWIYLNKTYQQRFCASVETWQGKTDFELWPADMAEKFRQSDLAALATGEPLEIADTVPEADGALSYWHTIKIPFQNTSGHRFVGGIAVDVTTQKHAEQELQARETLLRTIMENSPDPIFMADRACRMLYVNPASLTILNSLGRQPPWTQEALVGKIAPEFFNDPAVGRAMLESNQRVIESGQVVRAEERIATLGGARIYLSIRSPLRDNAGRIVGLVGIAHDITEQKQSEVERFARLERQRDALVREVHHRIKNHLQGVTGLLRNRITRHPELAEVLEEVITQICAIAHVYGLQSHRAEGGVQLDDLLEILAHGVAGSVSIQFLPAPEASGATAFLAREEAVSVALALNELVTNALKHNDGSEPTRPVRVVLEAEDTERRVMIRNGPAILPAAFDFAAGRGLGIGLELLRALLPPQGAALTFHQEADEVVAKLRLMPPVVHF